MDTFHLALAVFASTYIAVYNLAPMFHTIINRKQERPQ